MAKAAVEKAILLKSPVKRTTKTPVAVLSIDKIAETIHTKLVELNIEPKLQADIEWCLGSYRHDQNPVGLFEMSTKALEIFKTAHAKKAKGVTAKLIADIEKTLKSFK
jgi:hypothetical protein